MNVNYQYVLRTFSSVIGEYCQNAMQYSNLDGNIKGYLHIYLTAIKSEYKIFVRF